MRAPVPSEPNSTFPTYQVPEVSAMRGSASPVQVARGPRGGRADPPEGFRRVQSDATSVINGSSCHNGNSNYKMQSVTDICLLNSVTVPNKQRNGRYLVTNNNSSKLEYKFGADLLSGHDIPIKKSDDDLERTDDSILCARNDCDYSGAYTLQRLIEMGERTRRLQRQGVTLPRMRLCGGGESSLSTGTSGWGTPPSQQASNNNGKLKSYFQCLYLFIIMHLTVLISFVAFSYVYLL